MASKKTLKEQLAKKKASLAIAQETYDKLLADPTESYKFDSGEGSQQRKNRKLEELSEQIEKLENSICALESRLRGTGVVSVSTNRSNRCRRTHR